MPKEQLSIVLEKRKMLKKREMLKSTLETLVKETNMEISIRN